MINNLGNLYLFSKLIYTKAWVCTYGLKQQRQKQNVALYNNLLSIYSSHLNNFVEQR